MDDQVCLHATPPGENEFAYPSSVSAESSVSLLLPAAEAVEGKAKAAVLRGKQTASQTSGERHRNPWPVLANILGD
jgi:hypothetical protein